MNDVLDNIEFINLSPLDINPFMSRCEIKVFYLNRNRNRSEISKEVAKKMAKSVRGCPIVGYYSKDKEDFGTHEKFVTVDDKGIHYNTKTVPYGFVDPASPVWFQEFQEVDDAGQLVTRTYLMTQGYLWTGQFEEAEQALENENPHSMELDPDTQKGNWSRDPNTGLEFFIISDAIFKKLCILGMDVEPCFEGSKVTAPTLDFTIKEDTDPWIATLFTMVKELNDVVSIERGNTVKDMDTPVVTEQENAAPATDAALETSATEVENKPATETESVTPAQEDFKKDEKEEGKSDKEDKTDSEEEKKDDKKDKDDYALVIDNLRSEMEELKASFAKLQEENKSLSAFKANTENQAKDKMINETFYMLSDEDKKDIIEHKSDYTLDEIYSKLAIMCFEKRVPFDKADEKEENNAPAVTFNFAQDNNSDVPEWAKAVLENKNM